MSEQDGPEAEEPRTHYPARPNEPFVIARAESTRELRDLARRRRDAEEKLQQHLLEAKEKAVED